MRGHGEATSASSPESEERKDPECSSPPCKRLKQAVLSFNSTSKPQDVANNLTAAKFEFTNGFDVEKTRSETSTNVGGLVKAAPSPTTQLTGSGADVEVINFSSESPERSRSPSSEDQQSPVNDELNGVMASQISTPNTPKNNLNTLKSPLSNKSTEKLTKEERQKRKEEKEKEKVEKQKLREEREKQRLEAKQAKEQEKLEAKKKREQERLERQAEKERKEKEKQEEKERKEKERLEKKEKEEKERLDKLAKKDEERKRKEDEKIAKLEEKRKLEEEKRQQEEEQIKKKQKVQQAFVSFFTKQVPSTPKTVPKTNDRFKPFEIKPGMTLAPVLRRKFTLDEIKEIDRCLIGQGNLKTYLEELRVRKPLKLHTRVLRKKVESTDQDDDIVLIGDGDSNSNNEVVENRAKSFRPKLLQFKENTRPPYFGTWRKKSKYISPRNPFKKDNDLLDYSVDSDDEWEEEEPGESLSHSEGEDEGEIDDEDDNDGFFVPHGYLSDDEGIIEDEIEDDGNTATENGDQSTMEKCREQRLQAKVKAWEAELKKKCKPMKPVSIGCLWFRTAEMNTILKQFTALCLVERPIAVDVSPTGGGETGLVEGQETSCTTPGNHPSGMYVPEEAMPDLIRLVHGNVSGLAKLRDLFRRQWTAKCLGKNNLAEVTDVELEKCPVSKRQLERKIQSIAVKEKRGVFDKVRWYVHSCVLSKYGMDNLSVTETMADMSNDGRKSPCQSSTALGMPTIKQFVQPASPLARQASPPSIGTNKGSLNSIDSSLQNGILNAPSMASTRPTIHGPSTKIQSKQSIVARNILGKNLGNKNLPVAVLSKPTVIVLDDDDGSGGGNEQNSTHIAVLQETYPEINGITSPPVKKRSLCFSEQKDGKLESEVRQETVPMEIDE